MPAIILLAVWKNFGYNMLIFIAGLQSIPRRSVRGGRARRRRRRCSQFWHVTLPMLAPTFFFVGVVDDDRLLPAVRRAVRDDAGRAAARDDEPRAATCTRKASAGGGSASPRRSRFCCSSSSSCATAIQLRLAAEARRHEARAPRATRARMYAAARHRRAALAASRSLWMVRGLVHAARARRIPFRRRCCRDHPTLAALSRCCSTRLSMGRYLVEQRVRRDRRDGAVADRSTRWPGTRSRSCAFAGRDSIFRALAAGLVIPVQVAMLPLFLLMKSIGLDQHATGA